MCEAEEIILDACVVLKSECQTNLLAMHSARIDRKIQHFKTTCDMITSDCGDWVHHEIHQTKELTSKKSPFDKWAESISERADKLLDKEATIPNASKNLRKGEMLFHFLKKQLSTLPLWGDLLYSDLVGILIIMSISMFYQVKLMITFLKHEQIV
jgi:hypothetical protein